MTCKSFASNNKMVERTPTNFKYRLDSRMLKIDNFDIIGKYLLHRLLFAFVKWYRNIYRFSSLEKAIIVLTKRPHLSVQRQRTFRETIISVK